MSDDGQVCCILAVCCPPGGAKQREALAAALESAPLDAPGGIGERTIARTHADYLIDNFDLAPKGSLELLKSALARMGSGRK